MRSLLSAPADGRSGPDPGLTRLIKQNKKKEGFRINEKLACKAKRTIDF